MARQQRYVVSITRLNIPHTVYASVPAEESALKLAEKARELGYKDVTVYPEKEFRKIKNAHKKARKDAKAIEETSPKG